MTSILRYCLGAAGCALLLITSGCVIPTLSLHTTRNVAISLTEVDSGKPVGCVPIRVRYCSDFLTPLAMHIELRLPSELRAETDENGKAVIPLADYAHTYFDVNTNDWRGGFKLKPSLIREGGVIEEAKSYPLGRPRVRLTLEPVKKRPKTRVHQPITSPATGAQSRDP